VQGAFLPDAADSALVALSMFWEELLAPTPLRADANHVIAENLGDAPVTHVRFNIHPDGGVNRVRLFGTLA
jgi:allantoicase